MAYLHLDSLFKPFPTPKMTLRRSHILSVLAPFNGTAVLKGLFLDNTFHYFNFDPPVHELAIVHQFATDVGFPV